MNPRQELTKLRAQVSARILGQPELVEQLLLALLADGHVLLEGLPGLAKTRTVKTLASCLEARMRRIQFTPDLLPSDLTGTEILQQDGNQPALRFEPGPLFGNLILADEINRAPAKVQAALLEAMEERQITVAGTSHAMPRLFLVLATQNPIEQEGTYPLPEAQLDRFVMKVTLSYPSHDEECNMLRLVRSEEQGNPSQRTHNPVRMNPEIVFTARREISDLYVAPAVDQYIVDLVHASRPHTTSDSDLQRWLSAGASPRAAIALDRVARAHAWLAGQDHVTPDNVRAVCYPVLRHRLRLSYDAIADGVRPDEIVSRLLDRVAIPA